jgi:GNAT superfamily N-acetyltransferase
MAAIDIREAEAGDLEAIVRLHEADALGGHGDAWTPANAPAYRLAFDAIASSPDNRLFVALLEGSVVGTFQLSFIPLIPAIGGLVARLEAVQVHQDLRSRGIGAAMVAFAEGIARQCGAGQISLTSNKRRHGAHRFYAGLGYEQSHEGFRKVLS